MIRACVIVPTIFGSDGVVIYDLPLDARIQCETPVVDGAVVAVVDCDPAYLDALPEEAILWAE